MFYVFVQFLSVLCRCTSFFVPVHVTVSVCFVLVCVQFLSVCVVVQYSVLCLCTVFQCFESLYSFLVFCAFVQFLFFIFFMSLYSFSVFCDVVKFLSVCVCVHGVLCFMNTVQTHFSVLQLSQLYCFCLLLPLYSFFLFFMCHFTSFCFILV